MDAVQGGTALEREPENGEYRGTARVRVLPPGRSGENDVGPEEGRMAAKGRKRKPQTCRLCGLVGHNAMTCKRSKDPSAPPAAVKPKKSRGGVATVPGSVAGGIRIEISIEISAEQIMAWDPARSRAFLEGIASLVAAQPARG